jgi:hypothetical protein
MIGRTGLRSVRVRSLGLNLALLLAMAPSQGCAVQRDEAGDAPSDAASSDDEVPPWLACYDPPCPGRIRMRIAASDASIFSFSGFARSDSASYGFSINRDVDGGFPLDFTLGGVSAGTYVLTISGNNSTGAACSAPPITLAFTPGATIVVDLTVTCAAAEAGPESADASDASDTVDATHSASAIVDGSSDSGADARSAADAGEGGIRDVGPEHDLDSSTAEAAAD